MPNAVASDERIVNACSTLFVAYNYSSDSTLALDSNLPDAILSRIASWGLGYENEEKHVFMTQFSAAVPDLMFRSHPFEVKVHIGTWIWLSYTIEFDTASIGQAAISQFQRLFVAQKPQQHPLLDRYAAILANTYDFSWDQLASDCIITSSMQLIWTCVLEPKPIYRAMPSLSGGHLWPATIRSRNGLGEALSFMTFLPPKEIAHNEKDFVTYLQAIPQIQIFLNFTNDILRFKSEEVTKEHQNYVRERSAHHPDQNLADTLDEMVLEAAAAVQAVDDLLKGAGWIEDRWKDLRQGFVAMHRWNKAPYMRDAMGLSEEIAYKQVMDRRNRRSRFVFEFICVVSTTLRTGARAGGTDEIDPALDVCSITYLDHIVYVKLVD
ncbi:terpenoid synthase [Dothidotthia symphoricarpi CBS 119687]|uniref:Terpenoid synthase n=1 Tax=Dothidotthia symphoricarpi CBS 119687 TaxID=1392245 RepID=A0A6A6ACK3_9PLEO|nr:terpenoid synthase [Dothidotthia symphoricarpi CBS 119687]KAF2129632.1 terpenoid synthase [Dothidotthia symphoricarpi CBS 119687]